MSEYDFPMQQRKYTFQAKKVHRGIAVEDQNPIKLSNFVSPRRANQTQLLDKQQQFNLSSQSKGRRTLKADEFIAKQIHEMGESKTQMTENGQGIEKESTVFEIDK